MQKVLLFFFAVLSPAIPALSETFPVGMDLILDHHEECVQQIDKTKVYLKPESLQLQRDCFSLVFSDNQTVLIPYLFEDPQGYYILCRDGYYYWECTDPKCGRSYSYIGGHPYRCSGCGGTSFRKVKVG